MDDVASMRYLSYFVIDPDFFSAKNIKKDAGLWLAEIKAETQTLAFSDNDRLM